MTKIVECVANFSEGRRRTVIETIVGEVSDVPGVKLLGWEADGDHNRAVVTFAGEPGAVAEAAYLGIRAASTLIDMDKHTGQHPRIGAADVVPFVPLHNVSMEECVQLAQETGKRVARELGIPVFLYEHAALQAFNRNLANIRRGGYEGLCQTLISGEIPLPDFGPRQIGSAGACAIGARDILIAINVHLNSKDVAKARRIARAIRESSGGLSFVKALGFMVKERAQVSMNLTNYRVTSVFRALEAVRQEAMAQGCEIENTELIGLLPQDALLATDETYVAIDNFSLERILELRLPELVLP